MERLKQFNKYLTADDVLGFHDDSEECLYNKKKEKSSSDKI